MKSRILLFMAALILLTVGLSAAVESGANPTVANPAAPVTGGEAVPSPVPADDAKKAYVFPLKGAVDSVQLTFLRRALKEAEKAGAGLFLIEMDTPGGDLTVTLEILELLRKTKLPTATFINPNAISAGAIISLGTEKICMRKDAVIGAAAVVMQGGQDVAKSMKEKVDSFTTAKLRAVAEENGHNPDIAEAFMVTEKELKIGDIVLDGKETLLSLNGGEAVRKFDGRNLLAAGLAESVEEVARIQGFAASISRIEATGFESVAFWLTKISPILLLGAIVGAYIEMKAPGFGIPGIVSLACFALFFLGHYVAALSGMEAAFVFVIGAMLVIVEVFILPGTIIPGMIGAVLVVGSVLWAMVDYWPSQPGTIGAEDFERPLVNLLIALGGAAVFAAAFAKMLPKTSFYRKLVLASGPEDSAGVSDAFSPIVAVGDDGIAHTKLRPAGKAEFEGEFVDVISDGAFVEAGAKVRVVLVEGAKVVVEEVK